MSENTSTDALADMIKAAVARVDAMSPTERRAMFEAQRDSYCRAEAAFGSDADEAEYAAALASGDPDRIAAVKRKEAERVAAYDAYRAANP